MVWYLANDSSVDKLIDSLEDDKRKSDTVKLVEIMQSATGETPKMWGTSIVGFGTHHYRYESGREGDTMTTGLVPRKAALVLYGVMYYDQFSDKNEKLLPKLGEHTTGKGCLYIKDLSKVNTKILRLIIAGAYKQKTDH